MSLKSPFENDRQATSRALLPHIPNLDTKDESLRRFAAAVKEHLEVRYGSRGSPFERAVTFRDLNEAGLEGVRFDGVRVTRPINTPVNGVVVSRPTGYGSLSLDEFANSIVNTRLFQDLTRRIDDPARFDAFPEEIRNLLRVDIAEEAAKRGADIRELQERIQSETRSLAVSLRETTASLGSASAGVRETVFAFASATQATAGRVTQLKARLDDVEGSGVTIEEVLFGSASTDGLRGQYTLKISAGGALAGFGLAAEDVDGTTDSAFIIMADKFALVSSSYTGGLTNTPNTSLSAHIPFGVDGVGVYINGTVRIGPGGSRLSDLVNDVGINIVANSQYFKYNSSGVAINSTITLTAQLYGGLTGFVDWDIISGYTGSVPADGTANTATINVADMTGDTAAFQITLVVSSVTYTDLITLVKLRDGVSSPVSNLSNSFHGIATDAAGGGGSVAGAVTRMFVFIGLTDDSLNWTYTASATGVSGSLGSGSNKNLYTVSSISQDTAYVTITATKSGFPDQVQVFTITRVKQGLGGTDGTDGAPAKNLYVTASSTVMNTAKDGTVTPSSITFNAVAQNSASTITWSSTPGGLVSGTGATKTLTSATLGANRSAIITATMVDGATFTDSVTVVRVFDGSDALTVTISNPSATLPATNAGVITTYNNVLGQPIAAGSFTVYRGGVDVTASASTTYSVGASTGFSTAPTTAVNNTTNTYAITGVTSGGVISNTADTASVIFNVEHVFNGVTYTVPVTLNISKAKAGPTGATGTGTAGARGSALLSASTTKTTVGALVNADFTAVVAARGLGSPVEGDTVSLYNSSVSPSFVETRFYQVSLGSWVAGTFYLSGNAFIDGTLAASKLTAGTFTLAASNATIYIGTAYNGATGGLSVTRMGAASPSWGFRVEDNAAFTPTGQHPVARFWGYREAVKIHSWQPMSGFNKSTVNILDITGSGAYGAAVETEALLAAGYFRNTSVIGGDGIRASAASGHAAVLTGNASFAPLQLTPQAALPLQKPDGAFAYVGQNFYMAAGGNWYRFTGLQLVP